jgi:hypothetical protein
MAEVFVASQTAVVEYDGAPTRIKKGVTRVESGHALLKQHPDLFKPAETSAQFRVRDARAASDEPTSRYASLKAPDLKAEIAKRNKGRTDADMIVPAGKKNADLVAALEADDAAQSAKGDGTKPEDGQGPAESDSDGKPTDGVTED